MKFPSKKEFIAYAKLYFLLSILFTLVYGFTNWFTQYREWKLHLYFDFELGIPFIPEFIFIYFSIMLLFWSPIFFLEVNAFYPLAKSFCFATVTAGLLFLALPAELGFKRPEKVLGFETIYSLLYQLELPHNLVPSLHITYSFLLSFWNLAYSKNNVWKFVFAVWLLLICLSVLFVHQHHILDIFAGILLALISFHIFHSWEGQRRSIRIESRSSPES